MPEWKEEIRKRLAGLKLAPTRESEITEELAQHLEDRYQELLIDGMAETEACDTALAELSDSQVLAGELIRVERMVKHEPVAWGGKRKEKPDRGSLAGSALRTSGAAQEPRLYGNRPHNLGSQHRREYRNL